MRSRQLRKKLLYFKMKEKATIIQRKLLAGFHSEPAVSNLRKLYQTSVFAGAMKAQVPELKLNHATTLPRNTATFGKRMLVKDWGDKLNADDKLRLRPTPRSGFPNFTNIRL